MTLAKNYKDQLFKKTTEPFYDTFLKLHLTPTMGAYGLGPERHIEGGKGTKYCRTD